ncbi:response regulator [Pseudomonas sp. PHC1]|uniref:response regulator n=1 Tax=Pseudomonas sp. PHC1 TaxID=3384759 RepID=UPI00396F2A62
MSDKAEEGFEVSKQIIIVDPHVAMRMAIRSLLECEGFKVVSEVDNGAEALQVAQVLKPDLMILEIDVPNLDGLTVIQNVVARKLPTRIVVYTGQQPSQLASRCLQIGAHAFISKKNDPNELLLAASAALENEIYFSNIPYVSHRMGVNVSEYEMLNKLSVRELRVMQQIVQGLSNKEIAARMFLSNKTISTYKSRILQKLNMKNIIDLHGFASRNGLV